MIKYRLGADQGQPSLKLNSTDTSPNTDLSLFTHLATVDSSGETLCWIALTETASAVQRGNLLDFFLINSY